MTGTLWKLGGCLTAGFVALTMVLWGLERSALVEAAVRVVGESGSIPTRAYVLVFAGLVLLSLAVYCALTTWGGFLKANPETRQLPVWLLLAIIVVAGAASVLGLATHWGYIRSLDVVPMAVNQGYIAYQVLTSAAVLGSMVLIGVRWAPGYRPRVMGARP
jgi:hypothetical protein